MSFNDFYWHDAVIKNIAIDRNNPGHIDTVLFEIKFPDKPYTTLFVFEGVYWANLQLNFGIIAEETILSAEELDSDDDLYDLLVKWGGRIDGQRLRAYKIELNSTGGVIKIIARSFRTE